MIGWSRWGGWLAFLAAAGVVGVGLWWRTWRGEPAAEVDLDVRRFAGGTLVIVGGGRTPPVVRKTFVDFAGGARGKLVVVPAYAYQPEDESYFVDQWRGAGMGRVVIVHAENRAAAERPDFGKELDDCTAVWISGGAQALLSERYVGTPFEARLKKVVERGGTIGGSSAGAAAMTKVMIETGVDEAVEEVGFDLLPDAVIDQHFFYRNRLQRLHDFLLSKERPELIGIGIDEGMALVVNLKSGRLITLGDSYACAVVPRSDQETPRFAILSHGDETSLKALRDGSPPPGSRLRMERLLGE